jgi:hypothetical protein
MILSVHLLATSKGKRKEKKTWPRKQRAQQHRLSNSLVQASAIVSDVRCRLIPRAQDEMRAVTPYWIPWSMDYGFVHVWDAADALTSCSLASIPGWRPSQPPY